MISDKIGLLCSDSLKAISARWVLTLGTGTGIERILKLVRYMIPTRLLVPDDFGRMILLIQSSALIGTFVTIGYLLTCFEHV